MTDAAAGRSAGAKAVVAATVGHRYRDIFFAAGVVAILVVLFLPLPAFLLDIMLALSISVSVLVLMVAIWSNKATEFTSFPTVLLVVTMLRLALNVASTRLVLSEGHTGPSAAGHVIEGFAMFIMGGNIVIGLIVFAILVIINFMVITKGAGRIAEVAARFTLDAIPGKQMAIDADLSAGIIDEAEARSRRKELEEESSFYGAMDGASKFVRGDAVAGLIITFINLIGGIVIGVLMHSVPFVEALNTYSILTVGDGLVSQIPALIVSLAAGLIVTKGGTQGSADEAVFQQLGARPKPLWFAAVLSGLLAVTPGLPFLPFALLGAVFGGIAWTLPYFMASVQKQEAEAVASAVPAPSTAEETVEQILRVDELMIELGNHLLPLLGDRGNDAGLTTKVRRLRDRFATEYGFVLPSVRIVDDGSIGFEKSYRILVHGTEVANGSVEPDLRLAISRSDDRVDLPGKQVNEPAFKLPACWIDPLLSEEAEGRGYTVVDPVSVVVTHVTEAIKDSMASMLTYGAVQRLLDLAAKENPKLVSDTVPGVVSLTTMQRILQSLLNERVSIRNLPLILEAVAEAAGWTRNSSVVVEHVRRRLGPQITRTAIDANGMVPAIMLSGEWEQEINRSVETKDGDERRLNMQPTLVQEFLMKARQKIQAHIHEDPVVLVSADARPFVRSMLERIAPNIPVFSFEEIPRKVPVRTLDQV